MSPFRLLSVIEPLESRIAPATIIVGSGSDHDGSRFSSADANNPYGANYGAPDTYTIKLSAGDTLFRLTPDGPIELIKVKQGSLIAFFNDNNGDNTVQAEELTGLALGKAVKVVVNGS